MVEDQLFDLCFLGNLSSLHRTQVIIWYVGKDFGDGGPVEVCRDFSDEVNGFRVQRIADEEIGPFHMVDQGGRFPGISGDHHHLSLVFKTVSHRRLGGKMVDQKGIGFKAVPVKKELSFIRVFDEDGFGEQL